MQWMVGLWSKAQELNHVHKLKDTGSRGFYVCRASTQKNPLKTFTFRNIDTAILRDEGAEYAKIGLDKDKLEPT